MGAISWAAGFYLFSWANNFEIEYKKDMASISAGEFTEHEYSVARKYIQKSKNSPNSHMVQFVGPANFYREIGSDYYYRISVGDTLAAKHVNGKVWFDAFDGEPCTGQGKWFFLGLGGVMGLVPMTMAGFEIVKGTN